LKNENSNWRVLLLIVSLTELIVGGGGRLFVIGPVTLRMLLFVLTQAVVWYSIVKGEFQIDQKHKRFGLVFFGITFLSAIIGLLNKAGLASVLTDLKPLLYWANLLFYLQTIRSQKTVELVKNIFKWSTALMAFGYLVVLVFWRLEIIDGWKMYQWFLPTEELSFRGNQGFFYKGFIFLPIGIFFWLQESGYRKFLFVFALYLAMLLTFTRGFWLLIFGIHLFYTVVYNTKNLISWLAIVLMLTSLYSVGLYIQIQDEQNFPEMMVYQEHSREVYEDMELDEWKKRWGGYFSQGFTDRESSLLDRIIQITQVLDAVSPTSLFVGHGFGVGTQNRPIHMEISYLEVFHKQGLMGLILWIWLFINLWKLFYQKVGTIRQLQFDDDAFVFFSAAVIMFGISFLNPFINSPMGLGMLAIAFVCLRPDLQLADDSATQAAEIDKL